MGKLNKFTKKNISLFLAGLISFITIGVIVLNIKYIESKFSSLDETPTTLFFSPGYKIELDNKPIAIYGDDVCSNINHHNLIFSANEKPHLECIRIAGFSKHILVHLVLDKQIITESWK